MGGNLLAVKKITSPGERSEVCDKILRSLPKWFGIESSIVDYVKDVKTMETWVSYSNNELTGFISINKHNAATTEIHVIGVIEAFHKKGVGKHSIDMGTEFNASPVKTGNKTYTDAIDISDQAKVNRGILNLAMQSMGFVNYPTEWWHWSYGDQYWAYMTKSPNSLFQRKQLKFEIRNATDEDAEEIAKINIDSWKTTYKGIVADTFLDELNY